MLEGKCEGRRRGEVGFLMDCGASVSGLRSKPEFRMDGRIFFFLEWKGGEGYVCGKKAFLLTNCVSVSH